MTWNIQIIITEGMFTEIIGNHVSRKLSIWLEEQRADTLESKSDDVSVRIITRSSPVLTLGGDIKPSHRAANTVLTKGWLTLRCACAKSTYMCAYMWSSARCGWPCKAAAYMLILLHPEPILLRSPRTDPLLFDPPWFNMWGENAAETLSEQTSV